MKRTSIYIAFVIAAVAVIFGFNVYQPSSEYASRNLAQQSTTDISADIGLSQAPELEDEKIAPTLANGNKFEQCFSIVKKVNDKRNSWRNNRFEVPEKIAKKYASDEILVALEALQLSSSTYLNEQIEASLKQLAVEQRIQKSGQVYPEEFYTTTEKGYKVVDMTRFFQRFLDAPETERIHLAKSIPLLAYDVEKIFNSTFSEDEIVDILSYIEDIESPFDNRSHVRDFRLIDFAAARGMLKIFNYLIQRGVKIENRPTMMNTLEVVIFRHKRYPDPKKSNTRNFQQVIQTLLSYELPVRIRNSHYGDHLKVGGPAQRSSYPKPDHETEEFFKNLGVDLGKRITHEYFLQESNPELIKALEDYGNQQLFGDLPNGQQDAIDCYEFVTKVESLIYRHDIQQTLDKVSAEHNGLSDKIIPVLNQMEPALVEVYMALEATPAPSNNITFDTRSITFNLPNLLRTGDLEKAKELLQKQEEISAEDRHAVFWTVVRSNVEHIGFLVENGLVPEFEDYQKAANLTPEQIKVLAEWDYKFESVDKRGKSLAFYAAFACNTELIDFVYEKDYPYHTQQWGEDPLASAIRYTSCRRWQGQDYPSNYNKKSMIKSLMKFKPQISMHHLQRMAELKLREVKNYQEIIEMVPELAVNDELLPSGYYVQPGEVWDGVRYGARHQ
ncbi:MAG: hypothetical protein OQJ89_05080 [Kangiellaceae bacterium]|nr:hypothetical protein [Kangiellaceae bacterium]MCW8998492.1 hypothetical protein [Kangiellaceae bacterium]MCW9016317.1 hypothetical protein [Kangiellaceae bacterium]